MTNLIDYKALARVAATQIIRVKNEQFLADLLEWGFPLRDVIPEDAKTILSGLLAATPTTLGEAAEILKQLAPHKVDYRELDLFPDPEDAIKQLARATFEVALSQAYSELISLINNDSSVGRYKDDYRLLQEQIPILPQHVDLNRRSLDAARMSTQLRIALIIQDFVDCGDWAVDATDTEIASK